MQLMFFLFNEKNITPSQYYFMTEGEKVMIRAFFCEIMQNREKMRGDK